MSEPESTTTAAPPRSSTSSGIKETVESILVAFILAFVFRAFVVEAFVIPTGSMATTLLGAHTRFHCPDCGYDFDVNYQPRRTSGDPESEDPAIPSISPEPLSTPIYCPNCGYQMPGTDYASPGPPDDPINKQLLHPPVFYGDRILVLKYLYMLQEPQRYDVVVFKAPTAMTTNYIKRLTGKPGEALVILDGDVYIRAPHAEHPTDFVIQPKPKAVQDSLWRIVYDNDFHPEGKLDRTQVHPWAQPWTVVNGSGWKLDDPATHGRVFSFASDSGSSRLRFDPQANPTAQTTSEYSVYDQQPSMPSQVATRTPDSRFPSVPTDSGTTTEMPVSDLDLRLTYTRHSGTGPVNISLDKRDHKFMASITPTQISLLHDFNGKQTVIGSPMPISNSSRPLRIELSNADYQVTLWVDGKMVAQSTPGDFAPNIPALVREYDDRRSPPPGHAEIEAEGQNCQIAHVSLWRDNYYYNDRGGVHRAIPQNFPANAVVLGPDEYFVMGDNSILSYDARCWETGVHLPGEKLDVDAGRVPARFLLGKAFFVYWPAGFLAYPGLPAFVPNFGAMRFIH